jgi:hypothetical protein
MTSTLDDANFARFTTEAPVVAERAQPTAAPAGGQGYGADVANFLQKQAAAAGAASAAAAAAAGHGAPAAAPAGVAANGKGGMPGSGGSYQSKPETSGIEGKGMRGFLITLRCTSPNAEAPNLVQFNFLKNLLSLIPSSARPKMEYASVKVVVVSSMQVKYDKARMAKMEADYNAALGAKQAPVMGRAGAPMGVYGNPYGNPAAAAAMAANPDDDSAYKDRLTGEDVRNDWEFTILLAIVIDPPAFNPTAAPAAPAAPQASAQ